MLLPVSIRIVVHVRIRDLTYQLGVYYVRICTIGTRKNTEKEIKIIKKEPITAFEKD